MYKRTRTLKFLVNAEANKRFRIDMISNSEITPFKSYIGHKIAATSTYSPILMVTLDRICIFWMHKRGQKSLFFDIFE